MVKARKQKLSEILEEKASEIRAHNKLLSTMTDTKVAQMIFAEWVRLINTAAASGHTNTETYSRLIAAQQAGKILSVDDITSEVILELMHKDKLSIIALAELFNTTRGEIQLIRKSYHILTKPTDEATELLNIAFDNIMRLRKLANRNQRKAKSKVSSLTGA